MKKILSFLITFCMFGFAIFAGDVAVFEDIGFSKDGNVYFFGMYGKTDKKFIPYGEIYAVDVAKNDFISNLIFKSKDKSCKKSSKEIYEDLFAKRYSEIKKYECYKPLAEDVLYIMDDESKKSNDEIVFKSFEESEFTYKVKLIPTYYGNKSSFYIEVNVYDTNDNLSLSYKAGTPSVKRANVTNYKIVKISTNKDKTSVVFVIEKTVEDENGTSIRYMVETKKLDVPVDGKIR